MSASSLRYQPRPDRNQALRARILALAYVRRRRRKKIPLAERQPLVRPAAANEVWSMDFVQAGWSDEQLADAFAYLGATVFTGYFLNYAQTDLDL